MNVDMTNLYRLRGMIPNRYWYQLNGQSAQANWLEQREAIYSRIQEQEEEVVPPDRLYKRGEDQVRIDADSKRKKKKKREQSVMEAEMFRFIEKTM